MKFFDLVIKNLKNILRSWTSIFLLFIGPLSILLLILLAFSSPGFRDIKVGYTADPTLDLNDMFGSLRYLGEFTQYTTLNSCKYDLARQKVHSCLDFRDMGNNNMHITHVFDNSREMVSILMIENCKNALLNKEETLVVSKTESMFDDFNQVSMFLHDSKSSIDGVTSDLYDEKGNLKDMRRRLEYSRMSFEGEIDHAEDQVRLAKLKADDVEDEVFPELDHFEARLTNAIHELNEIKITVDKLDVPELSREVDQQIEDLEGDRSRIRKLRSDLREDLSDFDETIDEVDDSVDEMKNSLSLFSDVNHELVSAEGGMEDKIELLQNMRGDLQSNVGKVSKLTSTDTKDLVHPFTINLDPLYKGSKKVQVLSVSDELKDKFWNLSSIQLLFPVIISMIIIFVSLIFANIVVLDELHSPAYFRNLILPISDFYAVLSIIFTTLMISLVQVLFVYVIGNSLFMLDIFANFGTIFSISFLLVLIFTLVGALIAYFIKTETTSLLVCTFVIIANFLLSGIIVPVERMGAMMSEFAKILPFTLGLSMLQQSIFYNVQLEELVIPVTLLMCYVVILMVAIYLVRVVRKQS